jgi:hypothetical protein
MARYPLGSEPARSSRDSLRRSATSRHAAGIAPNMRTKVEPVNPSDDGDGDDDGAVGAAGKGTRPPGARGECPPANALVRVGAVPVVRSSFRRAPRPLDPVEIGWVALAGPIPAGRVGEVAETVYPAAFTGIGAFGETGAARSAAGPTLVPPPTGGATWVTGGATLLSKGLTALVTGGARTGAVRLVCA